MSFDLVVWKRSARTKTAMLQECYDAIIEEKGHTAMDLKNFRHVMVDMYHFSTKSVHSIYSISVILLEKHQSLYIKGMRQKWI